MQYEAFALRMDETAIRFIQHCVDAGKPIAAICHGPWTLIETGAVTGKMMRHGHH
jgi:protease I